MISTSTIDKGNYITDSTSMSPFEEIYHTIQTTSDPTNNYHLLAASDTYHLPYWIENLPSSLDYILHTLLSDESIMEVMSLDEMPWKYHHHQSTFLPHYHMVEEQFASVVSSNIITHPQSPILTCDVEFEGN